MNICYDGALDRDGMNVDTLLRAKYSAIYFEKAEKSDAPKFKIFFERLFNFINNIFDLVTEQFVKHFNPSIFSHYTHLIQDDSIVCYIDVWFMDILYQLFHVLIHMTRLRSK